MVRREKARDSSGRAESHPATFAPAGSSRGGRGSDEASEAPDVKGPFCGSASEQAVIQMNTKQIPKPYDADADSVVTRGRLPLDGKRAKDAPFRSAGVIGDGMFAEEFRGNTGSLFQSGGKVPNQSSVRNGLGWGRWRRGPQYRRSGVTSVEGRGLGSREMQEEAKARRLA